LSYDKLFYLSKKANRIARTTTPEQQLKQLTRPTALNKADPRGVLRSAASIWRPAYAGPAGLRSAPYADAAPDNAGTSAILIGMMLQDPMPTGGARRSLFLHQKLCRLQCSGASSRAAIMKNYELAGETSL